MSSDLIRRSDAIESIQREARLAGGEVALQYADMFQHAIKDVPSADRPQVIDIIHCNECKWEWTQKCPPHRMGLIHDSSDFCSYGVRADASETDKHDEAVEALGHLIKRMKGANDD